MVALVGALLRKIFYFLRSVLPSSPFANALGQVPTSIHLGLAWLNTIVPIGQIVALVTAWGLALFGVVAVKLIYKYTAGKFISVVDVS